MILAPRSTGNFEIKLNDSITLKSEDCVKCLGVKIDRNLTFSDHISTCCTKAARQLNALARISRYLNTSSRKIIYKSFIQSNFSYCPLTWHFCGKGNNSKVEKIQERALRLIYSDHVSSYDELLIRNSSPTMLVNRLRQIAVEIFKSIHNANPPYVSELM